jgi:hypothetical protein
MATDVYELMDLNVLRGVQKVEGSAFFSGERGRGLPLYSAREMDNIDV